MVQMGEGYLHEYLIALGKQISNIQKSVLGTRVRGLDQPIHMIRLRDWVFVKTFSGDPLGEKRIGPYQVLLTTFTAIKIREQPSWIHYSRIKRASVPWTVEQQSPLKNNKMTVISLILLVMMVAMSPGIWTKQWDGNLHLILIQNITQILHKNDCWICTQTPTSGESKVTLTGIPIPGSLHLSVDQK